MFLREGFHKIPRKNFKRWDELKAHKSLDFRAACPAEGGTTFEVLPRDAGYVTLAGKNGRVLGDFLPRTLAPLFGLAGVAVVFMGPY